MKDTLRAGSVGFVFAVSTALASPPPQPQQRFMYPAPPAGAIEVRQNVPYGNNLHMDVYRPAKVSGALPVLVFFHLATGGERANPFSKSWAEVAASQGLVAVLPDLTAEDHAQQFDTLIRHIASNGPSLGMDGKRIAVFAGSGNVYRALPILQDPARTGVSAAVMFYGSAPVPTFRLDLPVLFVRAGLDRPPVNVEIAELVAKAVTVNAPVTLLNYPGGHHAFEIVDDNQATRDVIDQAIAFVKQATSPEYRAALTAVMPEARAAGHVIAGRFGDAASAYASLVAAQPDNARLRLSYGEALLGQRQFAQACAEFEKLRTADLGPRDRGVPAARACMQSGNADAAIGWIASIPARFRPRELQSDPIFTPLRDRADFRALFEGRE